MKRQHRAEEVVAYVDQQWEQACARCRAALLGQDAVLSLFLGFADGPSCCSCLARIHDRELAEFLRESVRRIRDLECYRAGWIHAERRLAANGPWPEERIPSSLRLDDMAEEANGAPAKDRGGAPEAEFTEAVERFDAGDKGCGELALALKARMQRLEPGSLLHLSTTDLGAPEDLPAWCRLTGHRLLRAEAPHYLIARKQST